MEEATNKKKRLEHENQVREKIGAELDEEIARKQDKVNRENGNAILSSAAKLLGKGKYANMEKENTTLKERLASMAHKMKTMGQEYRSQLEQTSERQTSLEAIIKRQQSEITQLHKMIEEKDKQMVQLDRLAYPQRYRLSSGAVLDHIFIPNYLNPSLHIWTKVGDECFENIKYDIPDEIAKRHFRGELTDEEFVNAIFEPQEQVNEIQAQLLGTAFMLASGGPAQAHVGTGGGGSQSNLLWGEKKKSTLRR